MIKKYTQAAFGIILALLPAYLYRFQILNIPTTALEVMVGLFLFIVLVTHYRRESWEKIKNLGLINYGIGGLVIAAVISTLISPEPVKALGQLKAFFIEPILMFYAVVVLFQSKKELILPLKFLFWSTLLISLFGIVQYWTHLFLPLRFWGYGLEVKRITSVFEYPNALALYLAPLAIFFLVLYIKNFPLVKRVWFGLGLITMFTALILTSSRGAWIAVVAGLLVLILQKKVAPLKKLLVGTAILILVLSPLLATRIKGTFHDASSAERVALYKTAVSKILDEPIFGNGLYGFRTTLAQSAYTGEVLNYPHNIILNFWIETGMLGILSIAFIIFISLEKYKRKPSVLSFAAALYLLAVFAHGMVDAPYFKNDLSMLFWSILTMFYIED